MTVMTQLRNLLKENNIEYENFIEVLSSDPKEYIEWTIKDRKYAADGWVDSPFISLHRLTPEQVLAITSDNDEVDKLKAKIKELEEAIQYWRDEYEGILNISIAYKDNCTEWRRKYQELKGQKKWL